jgi:hypothetical protein
MEPEPLTDSEQHSLLAHAKEVINSNESTDDEKEMAEGIVAFFRTVDARDVVIEVQAEKLKELAENRSRTTAAKLRDALKECHKLFKGLKYSSPPSHLLPQIEQGISLCEDNV